jgi:hypothetical protein
MIWQRRRAVRNARFATDFRAVIAVPFNRVVSNLGQVKSAACQFDGGNLRVGLCGAIDEGHG